MKTILSIMLKKINRIFDNKQVWVDWTLDDIKSK